MLVRNFLIAVGLILVLASFTLSIIPSGVYSWPKENKGIILDGEAFDMKSLQLSANVITKGQKKIKVKASDTEEQLLLVKSGMLTVSLHDSVYTIKKGSVALILPGDSYALENTENISAEYYLMKYSSKTPIDPTRGKSS